MNLLYLRKVVQVETHFWLNFVQVITCTGQNCTSFNLYFCVVQVLTCTIFLYKLELVQNRNLYTKYIYNRSNVEILLN